MNHSVICEMQQELQGNEKMVIVFGDFELTVYPSDKLMNYKGSLILKRDKCRVYSDELVKEVTLAKSEIIINTDLILFITKREVRL